MAKFVVGLRGGIGTGKSAVSNIFESLGVDIADADISSRNVSSWPKPQTFLV